MSLLSRPRLATVALPIGILTLICLMIVPVPALLLDVFFVLNIALSVAILMAAMNAEKPLDFSSFPSVLLFATLLRLGLNIASTRVVLLHGHNGPAAAGNVIEAFGSFVSEVPSPLAIGSVQLQDGSEVSGFVAEPRALADAGEAIDRAGGAKTMRLMLAAAKKATAGGQQIVIFPEGTRQLPDTPADIKPGIVLLYNELKVPCVPIALNTGLCWQG